MTTIRSRVTRIRLCFCRDYAAMARWLGGQLEAANLSVSYDQWEGTEQTSRRSVDDDIKVFDAVVVLFSPSEGTPTWIGDAWKAAVYLPAVERGIPIFCVRGDDCAIPEFLSHLDFADVYRRGSKTQVHRLLRSVAEVMEESSVIVPVAPGPEPGDATFDPVDLESPPSVVVQVGSAFQSLIDPDRADARAEEFEMVRDGLFYELGVSFPRCAIELDSDLSPEQMIFVLNGVKERELSVAVGLVMVNETADELRRRGYNAVATRNPANDNPSAWVRPDVALSLERLGFTTWDNFSYLILTLSALLRDKAADFIGVREVRLVLDQQRQAFPLLVDEAVPKTVSEFVLADVLRRLVAEHVSIRNLRRILLALLDWGRVENDTLMLSEYVRSALRDQISHTLARGQQTLVVFLLDQELEEEIRVATRHTLTGSFVDVPADRREAIVSSIRSAVAALGEGVQIPPILTTMEIRAGVQRLVQRAIPRLWVTSYQEMDPTKNIQPIGRISPDRETTLRRASRQSLWE